jgi:oligopeptide transport system permease protein
MLGASMTAYLIRRVLWLIPVLFFVSLITFVIMHATPGGPWDTNPDSRTSDPRMQEILNRQYGLDLPLFFNPEQAQQAVTDGSGPLEIAQAFMNGQFPNWLWKLVHGDFGPSYRYRGQAVNDILFQPPEDKPVWQSRFGTTAFLGLVAMTFALVVGFPMGLVAGLKQNSFIDNASLFVATVGYGIPNFILGIFLIFIFAVWLGLIKVLEVDYWERWQSWILPAITLGIPTAAYTARLTRSSIIEVMRQDYVRTAHAKGLAERAVIWGHIVRNALIPVVTYIGPQLANLVTGAFVIEWQFSVNGIGRLFVESISRRDYTVILALTVFYAFLVAVANLSVDLVYGLLDPRIKVGGSER